MSELEQTSGVGAILSTNYVQPGALRLEFVSRIFDIEDTEFTALQTINLTVNPGEFVAIMGDSGSGKTTTLNILGLLDRPTSGSYMIGAVDTTKLSQAKRAKLRKEKFGFIFQNFNLLERYTVLQNIELAMMYHSVSAAATRSLALDLLNQLGLRTKANVHPHQLSGGQAQRIAIARALISNPPIILADEPTGNLDIISTQEIINLLQSLNRRGATIVMVTHSAKVAQAADRVVTMQKGLIVSDVASGGYDR